MYHRYLTDFYLPGESAETDFRLHDRRLDMGCYDGNNPYPFGIFPEKGLDALRLSGITVLCGGNGSGKSTLLNLIAEVLHIRRRAAFNRTPFFGSFAGMCRAETGRGAGIPPESAVITSDDVFDFLLNLRALNEGVSAEREALFASWKALREDREGFRMRSLADYEKVRAHREAAHSTRSDFAARRAGTEQPARSNGESAMGYFTEEIQSDALYLLDEPENSLSAALQLELAQFIGENARFCGDQFIIATHSPFLMAIPGAVVYDLDAVPVGTVPWTEIPSVRLYREFFREHEGEFDPKP